MLSLLQGEREGAGEDDRGFQLDLALAPVLALCGVELAVRGEDAVDALAENPALLPYGAAMRSFTRAGSELPVASVGGSPGIVRTHRAGWFCPHRQPPDTSMMLPHFAQRPLGRTRATPFPSIDVARAEGPLPQSQASCAPPSRAAWMP